MSSANDSSEKKRKTPEATETSNNDNSKADVQEMAVGSTEKKAKPSPNDPFRDYLIEMINRGDYDGATRTLLAIPTEKTKELPSKSVIFRNAMAIGTDTLQEMKDDGDYQQLSQNLPVLGDAKTDFDKQIHTARGQVRATSTHTFYKVIFCNPQRAEYWYSKLRTWTPDVCRIVAKVGSLITLQWAQQKEDIHWGESTCAAAAKHGHFDVLQWAHANGCRWDASTLEGAAFCGNTEMLNWAMSKGCPLPTNGASIAMAAAEGGKIEALNWAQRNVGPWNESVCAAAARGGQLDTLKYLRNNDPNNQCPWNEMTCSEAARYGHQNVIDWAQDNGCPWDGSTCEMAAWGGHLHILQQAREKGCRWGTSTCYAAALNGHLEILKWARENGCPWDSFVISGARLGEHLDIVNWARANGCPEPPV
ncbi:ankyrin repeat protein [Seminavis robusta]|uniref:Ankyrin repeat protein n=1 Tax=Seminavis robusta TaxID=568900 RepID=A0A9N8EW75_9STRA|nr:ankyrin repeat protein [Seminavis robusta]|eukprot:Sro2004_g310420.1 ankyrin repeat protein (420) ;mRNA; f:5409-6860